MIDVICLSSDEDDAGLPVPLVLKRSPLASVIDSDDDQPLEALKLQLKAKLVSGTTPESATEGQPTASASAPTGRAAAAQTAACTVSQAGNSPTQQTPAARCTASGKENTAFGFGNILDETNASAGAAGAEECDLDNWCLQPLQRRVRRRAGQTGVGSGSSDAAKAAAAADTSPGVGSKDGRKQQQQGQQQGVQDASAFLRHSQDCRMPASPPNIAAAADADAGTNGLFGDAEPSRKRQRQQKQHGARSSFDAGPADADPWYEADADAADAEAETGEKYENEAADKSNARGRGRAGARRKGGAAGAASSKVRMTAEERAAQRAEAKAHKEAEKIAVKMAKQAEKAAQKDAAAADRATAKAAKRFESFTARKHSGSFYEYESVLVMDATTSQSALGLAVAAELDRRRTMAWQVVSRMPLSGRWQGCSCFCFKRRKLCEKDEHELKTATTTQVHSFEEDVPPTYVQLVFEQAGSFMTEVQRDDLAGLKAAVTAAHPRYTLGIVVLGLKSYAQRLDNQALRQGTASQWDWRRIQTHMLQLHLSTPGLHLRLLSKLEEAATHLINTTRVIGQQPYTVENQLEACGGAGPGAASKAAAAAMAADLGPATCSFAVNTLGKMHGMGGNKAWAVAKQYPSFGALIAGFRRAAAVPGSNPSLLLQDLMEPAGSGKVKPRRVGQAMSKRLHLLLTCEDPDAIVEGGDLDVD